MVKDNLTQEHIRQSNLIEGVNARAEEFLGLRAWDFIFSYSVLTHECVLMLHRILMKNFPAAKPGRYRTCWVEVGGHTAPSPVLVSGLIRDWMEKVNKQELSPKEGHIQFEKIHPFTDGNGRIGRLLYWWHQSRLRELPTLFKFDERENYYEWFKENVKAVSEEDSQTQTTSSG